MLSQIRQISDGNYNNVFVKNKEQKFNLDKEIHDIECWKQSRNHVYRREERELLTHLEKLHHQQEYFHHLDEERTHHHPPRRGSIHHHKKEIRGSSHPDLSHYFRCNDHKETHAHPARSASLSLPPVADHKALHRTDAHTNICVVCQLPHRGSLKYGHHSTTEFCCCEHDGSKEDVRSKRFEEHHGWKQPPIQIGQRRHSLMMARLNDDKYEFKPHPPERNGGGHHPHSHHGHDSQKHDHDHHHHKHDHMTHGHHVHDSHSHEHHHVKHHYSNEPSHSYHTPTNSPNQASRQSLTHPHHHAGTPNHDHLHSPHHSRLHDHSPQRGTKTGDHQNGDTRRRDHELHWDRHQVHKLRGMITDPHYKEQLESEGGRVYPWSSQYQTEKPTNEDLEEMKNCRYLRFSKLNLESMKENPEKEVEVFEKNNTPS